LPERLLPANNQFCRHSAIGRLSGHDGCGQVPAVFVTSERSTLD